MARLLTLKAGLDDGHGRQTATPARMISAIKVRGAETWP